MSDRALFLLHEGLPQQAPGSDASTLEALRRLRPVSSHPRVLDLGCGPGRHTRVLARETGGEVVAVDLHAPFLEQLEREAAVAGLADPISTRCADFGALDLPPGSIDVLWSEGAIYHLGFEEGLRRWRPFVRDGGCAAVTELTWLSDERGRPDAVTTFWKEAYPAMTSIERNIQAAERSGFRVCDTFVLPPSDWEAYYGPLATRVEQHRAAAAEDSELAEVLAGTEAEIDLYRRFGDHYGYVFYLMRPR